MNDNKPIKISHSKIALYSECSKKYEYRYVQKLQPLSKGSSLFFGTAVDLAVQSYLKDKNADWKGVFEKNWAINIEWGRTTVLYDTLAVDFSYKDFDIDLFTPEDIIKAEMSKTELLPNFVGTWIEAKEYVTTRKKQRAHLNFTDNEHRYFNRLSWLSMNRKGYFMVKAFVDIIGPKIKKVIDIQKKVEIKNEDGDILTGYVDMVLELEDLGTVILDLKTAAMKYEELEALTSQQLGIYAAILGPEVGTDKVGFAVLLKNLEKDKKKVCRSCGFKGEGSHKTCNGIKADGKRCNGEWEVTLNPKGETQLVVETLTMENMQAILDTVSAVTNNIKAGVFYRNPNSCFNFNGCEYFEACWRGDFSKLKKKD